MQTYENEVPGAISKESQAHSLLPAFPEQSSFQIHVHDDSKPVIKLQNANIPQIVKSQLNEMLNTEFTSIISKSSTDFGRTNLVEMNLPTTGLPVVSNFTPFP